MKQKICITVDEETLVLVESILKRGDFRNRSHIFEHTLKEKFKDDKTASD